MGLFNRQPKPVTGNLDAPGVGFEPAGRTAEFQSEMDKVKGMSTEDAMAHIKANPKKDPSKPDERLHEIASRSFF